MTAINMHVLPAAPGESIDVGYVWSGFPVGFALLTAGGYQFAAYYDQDRRMTLARRRLDSVEWERTHLPEQLAWDSHNGIRLARDSAGCLHLSGNMHCVPLVYFRGAEPDSIHLERVKSMVGDLEDRVTYPEFFTGPGGQLCFAYRHGSSGNGDQLYNIYDLATRTWRRVSPGVIVSGEGLCNPYLDGPKLGPDGWFHLAWVWRDTPDCATNHDICYARSRDLAHWETSAGAPLALPITPSTAEYAVRVPAGTGLMNGNTPLGFDPRGCVLITYHTLDVAGHTQIFIARRDVGGWSTRAITDWTGAWLPEGFGSINFELRVQAPRVDAGGHVCQKFHHARHGVRTLLLDGETLERVGELPEESLPTPEEDEAAADDLQTRVVNDSAEGQPRFALRWESLPENRDRPVERELPPPSVLRLVRLA